MRKPKTQITEANIGRVFRDTVTGQYWRLKDILPPTEAEADLEALTIADGDAAKFDQVINISLLDTLVLQTDALRRIRKPKAEPKPPRKPGRPKGKQKKPDKSIAFSTSDIGYSVTLGLRGKQVVVTGETLRKAFNRGLAELSAVVDDFADLDTPEAQAMREAMK